jgi:hypothetical protein
MSRINRTGLAGILSIVLLGSIGLMGAGPPPTPVFEQYGGIIKGTTKDALTGHLLSNVKIGIATTENATEYFAEVTSDANGHYETPGLMKGVYYLNFSRQGYIKVKNVKAELLDEGTEVGVSDVVMSTALGDGQFRIVVSWCDQKWGAVADVDSYLSIPGVGTPLYYQLKGQNYYGTYLDLDDTNWMGPETTTIRQVTGGTYEFYVNNYNDRGDWTALGNSEVKVVVYRGDELLRTYFVPPGSGITYALFYIVDGQLVDLEQYDSGLWVSGH